MRILICINGGDGSSKDSTHTNVRVTADLRYFKKLPVEPKDWISNIEIIKEENV